MSSYDGTARRGLTSETPKALFTAVGAVWCWLNLRPSGADQMNTALTVSLSEGESDTGNGEVGKVLWL